MFSDSVENGTVTVRMGTKSKEVDAVKETVLTAIQDLAREANAKRYRVHLNGEEVTQPSALEVEAGDTIEVSQDLKGASN